MSAPKCASDCNPSQRRSIFSPSASLMCRSASALPRASSTGLCVCRERRRCLKFLFEVLHQALVERPEVRRRVPEGVLAQERVEVPVDELPVEAVVVGDEDRASRGVLADPVRELAHHVTRSRERQGVCTRETADRKGGRDELLGDRPQASIERALRTRLDHHRPDRHHRVALRIGPSASTSTMKYDTAWTISFHLMAV